MAATDDEKREVHWRAIQNELSPGETEIERTLSNLATIKFGWHRVRAADGRWAYFPSVPNHPQGSPEQREADDAFESRSLEMHRQQAIDNENWQQPQPVFTTLKDKGLPPDPSPFNPHSPSRDAATAPPKFHESAHSTERKRRLKVPLFHESHPASTEVRRASDPRSGEQKTTRRGD